MKLIIFGGAGYLGRFLVEDAVKNAKYSEILIVTRNLSKAMLFNTHENVSVINDIATITNEQLDIVNCAYPLTKSFRQIKSQNKSLFKQIEVLIANNTVSNLIHVSTIVLTLASWKIGQKIKKKNLYEYSKSLGEKYIAQISQKHSVSAAIIRSGNIIGPGSVWINKIGQSILYGNSMFGINSNYPSNATYVRNLSTNIFALIKNSRPALVTIDFAELAEVSWQSIAKDIFNADVKILSEENFDTFKDLSLKPKEEIRLIIKSLYSSLIKNLFKSQNFKHYVILFKDILFKEGVEDIVKKTVKSSSKELAYADYSRLSDLNVFSNTKKISSNYQVDNSELLQYTEIVAELKDWVIEAGYVEKE